MILMMMMMTTTTTKTTTTSVGNNRADSSLMKANNQADGKTSNSSNETVIARLDGAESVRNISNSTITNNASPSSSSTSTTATTGSSLISNNCSNAVNQQHLDCLMERCAMNNLANPPPDSKAAAPLAANDDGEVAANNLDQEFEQQTKKRKPTRSIKNLIHLASQHLTRIHHPPHQIKVDSSHIHPPKCPSAQAASQNTKNARSCSGPPTDSIDQNTQHLEAQTSSLLLLNNVDNNNNHDWHQAELSSLISNDKSKSSKQNGSHMFAWTQRYFNWSWQRNNQRQHQKHGHSNDLAGSKSVPNTPLKSTQNATNSKPESRCPQVVADCASTGAPGRSGGGRRRRQQQRSANGCTQTEPITDQLIDRLNAIKNIDESRATVDDVGADDQARQNPESGLTTKASGNNDNFSACNGQQATSRPSVRFVESEPTDDDGSGATANDELSQHQQRLQRRRHPSWCKLQRQPREQVKFADCGVQTSVVVVDGDNAEDQSDDQDGAQADDDEPDNDEAAKRFVARLFKLPNLADAANDGQAVEDLLKQSGESPMDSNKFRDYGYKLIDYISNYLDTIEKRRVTPINIEPGYLKSLIKPSAPEQGESFASIMQDFENHIMCGITHWQHPHFHAYFPAGNAYPSILADMLSDALGCVGFSWAASPAYTELEIIMLDWMGKMIGLPDEFLCLSSTRATADKNSNNDKQQQQATTTPTTASKGGGVIQGSASECVLVNLLAARHWAMEKLRKKYPGTADGLLLSRLIGYCSKEAHSCVEKASMIGFIRMRALETDERNSLRGDVLAKAIEADKAQGLEPFIVCATLGTTSCVSFDNLEELGQVCRDNDDLWLHVDAAYAGSALICPEFKYLMKGIEMATSFNMNPNKWMLINFDCSLMWVKDRFKLTRAFVVDPLYLQHSFSDQAIDYRHWGIPLSRRFRALKLWFVIRNYGVEGLRAYIRNHVRLAKLFEQLICEDKRFIVTNEVVLGLVCFRLIGSNALNQRLLSMINASGKLHMVPASVNGRYVIRFCVCDQNAKEADILYAYKCISSTATELFQSIRAGRERIRTISQQSTIDVSNISLHTQQSLSADRLDNSVANGGVECPTNMIESKASQQQPADDSNQGEPLLEQRYNQSPTTRSPLMKPARLQSPQQTDMDAGEHDDLEQEIQIDSLATIDGRDYDLCLDEVAENDVDDDDVGDVFDDGDDEGEQHDEQLSRNEVSSAGGVGVESKLNNVAHQQQQLKSRDLQSMSPMQRANYEARQGRLSKGGRASQTFAAGGSDEQEEAADEVLKLAEKRNRMSLRYKRKFFVRVVSDPRVYRASISGDINAHASTSSLGSSSSGLQQSSQPQPAIQQQPSQLAPQQVQDPNAAE